MNVLFLMEDLCFGGTQRQSLELARRLDRARFSPAILTLTGECDLDNLAADANIPLVHLGSSRKVTPFFFAMLGRAIRRLEPDVILPCTALPNIWARLWGKILKIPVLGTVRGGGAPARQHERFLWPLAAHFVCNSRPLVSCMQKIGVPASRISFIPNGVDTERFFPATLSPSRREQLIVCVARLAKDKNHETLLRAFCKIAPAFPTARLRLVGGGPEEVHLKRLVTTFEADTAARIEFAGATPDTASHYHAARIFVLASEREGTPNVVLEAMACSTPVCASSVGGIPDLAGDDALLFPPGDVNALAKALATLLEDDALADSLAAKGRERICGNYSLDAMVRAHEKILFKLGTEIVR